MYYLARGEAAGCGVAAWAARGRCGRPPRATCRRAGRARPQLAKKLSSGDDDFNLLLLYCTTNPNPKVMESGAVGKAARASMVLEEARAFFVLNKQI